MARTATTSDAFNAIAEPRRREILDVLRGCELPVGEIVERVGLTQPQVSKHLRVLREVGVVGAREDGRRRLYCVNSEALRPVHDWVEPYERMWSERFARLDGVLDDLGSEGDE